MGSRTRSGLRIFTAVILLSASSPATAHADMWCWLFGSGCGGGGHDTATSQSAPQRATPEIDPNALASAIALAAGGAALLGDRVRRRR
jgi:hypothetical protein